MKKAVVGGFAMSRAMELIGVPLRHSSQIRDFLSAVKVP
jgi:hypothetical protein